MSVSWELLKKTYLHMKKTFGPCGRVTCDPFVTFMCLYPEYKYSGKKCVLKSIKLEGEEQGHTEFEFTEDGHILLIDKINLEAFLEIFLKTVKNIS